MSEPVDIRGIALPHARLEAWKYTDLSRLIARVDNPLALPTEEPATARALLSRSLQASPGPRLVLLDGQYLPELSDPTLNLEAVDETAPPADPALAGLMALTPARHYRLHLRHSPEQPVQLLQLHSEDRSVLSNAQLSIHLDDGVSAELVEEHIGGRQGIAILRQDLHLATGARMRSLRLQHSAAGQFLIAEQDAHIADEAQLHETHVDWGSRLSRLQARRHLEGRHARLDYYALAGLGGEQQIDQQVLVRHASPQAVSRLRARGIVGGRARQIFNGKVLVERGAQGTDSDQLLRNLLLSEQAEVDAKPELEIYADDVRCAHGSTVGRLDDQALFYLRSRGIGMEQARRLLMLSFAAAILGEIADENLRRAVSQPLAEGLSLGVEA